MTDYYLDSSALVKRYVVEPGSAWVSSLFDFSLNSKQPTAKAGGLCP